MTSTLRPVRSGCASRQGFSLVEILVVVGLIAIAALIGVSQLGNTAKNARLQSAGRDIGTLAQRALNEMKTRGVATFLELSRLTAGPGSPCWQVRLFSDGDANGVGANGSLEPAADTLLQTLLLPQDITLSASSTTAITSTSWSVNSADSASRYLICDTLGRTFTPGPPRAQLGAVATLELSQKDMLGATPRLKPAKYELRIGPVWSVTVQRWVYQSGGWQKV